MSAAVVVVRRDRGVVRHDRPGRDSPSRRSSIIRHERLTTSGGQVTTAGG